MLANNLRQLSANIAMLTLVAVGFVGLTVAPANAAGGCAAGYVLCGGADTDNGDSTPTGGGSTDSNSGGGGSGGGGGGTVTYDPYAFTARETAKHIVSDCGVRKSDGKSALAKDFYYSKIFKVSHSGPPGYPWYFFNNSSGGSQTYARDIKTGEKCLWPSETFKKLMTCPVSVYAEIRKTQANAKLLTSASSGTGYRSGSLNYKSCVNARTAVAVKGLIGEFGFFKVFTSSKIENVLFEIPYTKNDVTGKIDAPKGISSSGVISTGMKLGDTASLDCKYGFAKPGKNQPNSAYTSSQNCLDSPKTGFVCAAPNPTIDIADPGKSATMRTIKGNIQLKGDGKPRKVTFNQSITGNGLKINSYQTRYKRSGSPWDSALSVNRNLLELSKSASGSSLWKTSSATNWMSGKSNSLYLTAITASNPGGKTTLTQELKWTGTKKVQSVEVVGVDVKTGDMKTRSTTVTVPTSGTCTQSVGIEYIRTIGDVQ